MEPQSGTPPVDTEPCYGRFGGGLRNGVLASPRHWHPTRDGDAPRLNPKVLSMAYERERGQENIGSGSVEQLVMRPVLDGPHHDAPPNGLDAQPIGGCQRWGLVVRALSAAASKVRCGQEHEHAERTPAAHVQKEGQAGFASAAVAADAQVARGGGLLEERRAELELFAAPPPAKRLCARLTGDEGGVGARGVGRLLWPSGLRARFASQMSRFDRSQMLRGVVVLV